MSTMEATKKDIIIFIACLGVAALLPLVIFGTDLYFKNNQEVQISNTYYVLPPYVFGMACIGLALFVTFFVRAIQTKFKGRLTRTFLALGAIVLVLVGRLINQMLGG